MDSGACDRLAAGERHRSESAQVENGFQALIDRAHRTRRTRARLIVEECLERLPHYRGLPEPLIEEIRASTLHHLALLYRVTLRTGRALTRDDLAYSRRLARKRAAQGVPLGEFLTFFLVGLTRTWEHLMREAGDDAALRDQLLDRVTAVISNQTQLMSDMTQAYVEERERLSRFRAQDVDELVRLLLAGDAPSSVIEARAVSLGIDLETEIAVAILGPLPVRGGGNDVGCDDVRAWLAARGVGDDLQVGRAGEGFVALLPARASDKALAASAEGVLGPEARVGVGTPGRGVESLRRSAREALRALRIGPLAGATPVCRFDAVAVHDLIGIDSARSGEFMRSVLGPLAGRDASASHLDTLRALAAHNYAIKLAAAELSIHPHTLAYRMRQLRRRFGLDLEDPELRLRLQLALRIRDARGPLDDDPAAGASGR